MKYRTQFVYDYTRIVHLVNQLIIADGQNIELHYNRPLSVRIAGSFRVMWVQFTVVHLQF